MNGEINLKFDRLPGVLPFYFRGAVSHHDGVTNEKRIGNFTSGLKGFKTDRKHLARFLKITGPAPDDRLPILYPHSLIFPLHMSILGHPQFPLSYTLMLQTGNHTLQHRQIGVDEKLDITCRIKHQQITGKGFEFDMHSAIRSGDELVWECINRYYFRGR